MSGVQQVVTKEDERYPERLKEIPDAPKQLYYKGNWDDSIFESCLAVVGARRMTSYGKRVTEQLVGELASSGITIVSGFMYGVDAMAHKAAVNVGGKTIAVMPCGIDLIHPEYQKDLYKEILNSGGLVISEYEGDTAPGYWTYPRRNRIVAGLSQAILVVEAAEKSGSLITASLAKKFGRTLFSVPGPITSAVSQGTLSLIEDGAVLVRNSGVILSYYKKQAGKTMPLFKEENGRNAGGNKTEKNIMEHLKREPMDLDTLSRASNISAAELGTALSLMQLNGFIAEDGGKYYVI
ncbi:MAG: DNA-protecting protein DprA [Candidatus Wildermuthbacteria bacterium]|nr:DNA-protecting protein DprA [Candidatus Wildermuthbacteria bacterium]